MTKNITYLPGGALIEGKILSSKSLITSIKVRASGENIQDVFKVSYWLSFMSELLILRV